MCVILFVGILMLWMDLLECRSTAPSKLEQSELPAVVQAWLLPLCTRRPGCFHHEWEMAINGASAVILLPCEDLDSSEVPIRLTYQRWTPSRHLFRDTCLVQKLTIETELIECHSLGVTPFQARAYLILSQCSFCLAAPP